MNKKFRAELMNMLLQKRVWVNDENRDFQMGYDSAMMEVARFINSYGEKPDAVEVQSKAAKTS